MYLKIIIVVVIIIMIMIISIMIRIKVRIVVIVKSSDCWRFKSLLQTLTAGNTSSL